MFDKQLFGYDKNQVENQIHEMSEKMDLQKRDLDYLRDENCKLKKQIKEKKESKKHKEKEHQD
ncbi:MAG: hypothetical protein IJW24_04375 [Clostridia bacterium]|nr:hypothetical protein [Clostridia bacterium]